MTCELYGHHEALKSYQGVFVKVCDRCGATLETREEIEERIEKAKYDAAGNKTIRDELAALIGEK